MKNKENYSKIGNDQYSSSFGLKNPENKKLHKKAFNKAWETRNFEIDKYWQRSAYYWGFIALIFTGYVIVVTGKSNETANGMHLDFYLILLGIIFSFGWLLVINASKRWQENWEKHIDCLENKITGPLYKTLYYKGHKYYSVSGINKILAKVVIVTWGVLLIQYFYVNLEYILKYPKEIIFSLLLLIGTIFCIYYMFKKGQTDGGALNAEFKRKSEHGVFFTKNKND
jgi:uncharacterized membrane protein YhaH (DUF805 family)